jgi:hypothetical protein
MQRPQCCGASAKPSACFGAATFRLDLIKYMGTVSNHLEGVGAESIHGEQAIVPKRLLQ